MSALPRSVPLIAASALFVENLSATVLSTALASIAADFGVDPVDLKLALTAYLISLAVFVPASGWVADRFGTRSVFRAAMAVFALGSIACAFADGIAALVAARVVQGIGGAMMIPVARLVVVRGVAKDQLIGAMAVLTMPALVGPIVGPPLGGFCATYLSWHWIFWLNVPFSVLGIALAGRLPQFKADAREAFDARGFFLIGPGLALALTGLTTIGVEHADPALAIGAIAGGAALLALYVWHARRHSAPVLDLNLLRIPTFRIGVLGGLCFRVGAGATPFLLPLLIQLGFDRTAFESGLITFATALGAFLMKLCAPPILRAAGFWNVLAFNGFLAGALIAAPILFDAAMPAWAMIAILVVAGFSRSLQFTSSNAVLFADMPPEKMSRATTFVAVLGELSGSIGITVAAIALDLASGGAATGAAGPGQFLPAFLAVGAIAGACGFVYATLPRDAGNSLTTRR